MFSTHSPTKVLITSITVLLGIIQLLFETFFDIIDSIENILASILGYSPYM